MIDVPFVVWTLAWLIALLLFLVIWGKARRRRNNRDLEEFLAPFNPRVFKPNPQSTKPRRSGPYSSSYQGRRRSHRTDGELPSVFIDVPGYEPARRSEDEPPRREVAPEEQPRHFTTGGSIADSGFTTGGNEDTWKPSTPSDGGSKSDYSPPSDSGSSSSDSGSSSSGGSDS